MNRQTDTSSVEVKRGPRSRLRFVAVAGVGLLLEAVGVLGAPEVVPWSVALGAWAGGAAYLNRSERAKKSAPPPAQILRLSALWVGAIAAGGLVITSRTWARTPTRGTAGVSPTINPSRVRPIRRRRRLGVDGRQLLMANTLPQVQPV